MRWYWLWAALAVAFSTLPLWLGLLTNSCLAWRLVTNISALASLGRLGLGVEGLDDLVD